MICIAFSVTYLLFSTWDFQQLSPLKQLKANNYKTIPVAIYELLDLNKYLSFSLTNGKERQASLARKVKAFPLWNLEKPLIPRPWCKTFLLIQKWWDAKKAYIKSILVTTNNC